MDFNKIHALELYDLMMEELNDINKNSEDVLKMSDLCIKIIRKVIITLRKHVVNAEFKSEEDEIHFFKSIKPLFYSQLQYYGIVYNMEVERPLVDREADINYLMKEQKKLTYFYEKHHEFYLYHRTGASYLDSVYFTRNEDKITSSIGIYGLDIDAEFTTSKDIVVAKILANQRLKTYVENELLRLQNVGLHSGIPTCFNPSINWTGSKASLVELMYGLQCSGYINNGNVSLQQIAFLLEKCFNFKLDNFSTVFQDIKLRKKNKTQFLDHMKETIIKKINVDDE